MLGSRSLEAAHSPPDLERIRVLEVVFASGVEDRTPLPLRDGVLRSGPLVFWTRLEGRQDALASLRDEKKLPIRHRWWRRSGPFNSPEPAELSHDLALELDLPLSAGTPEAAPLLAREVDERDFFDWRTWSSRSAVRPGTYCVDVVFNDASQVPLGPGVEPNGSERCRFEVTVE
jgi:hypothetical protein